MSRLAGAPPLRAEYVRKLPRSMVEVCQVPTLHVRSITKVMLHLSLKPSRKIEDTGRAET